MDKIKLLKYLLVIILILFTGLFLMIMTGYYETKNRERMVLTNEQIIKFEKDVLEGKEVDIEDYIVEEYQNYSNKFSKSMNKISLKIENTFEKVIIFVFNEVANTVEKG